MSDPATLKTLLVAVLALAPLTASPPPSGPADEGVTRSRKASLLAMARDHRRAGRTEEAQRCYETLLGIDPQNAEAHRALGHRRFEGVWMPPERISKIKKLRQQIKSLVVQAVEGERKARESSRSQLNGIPWPEKLPSYTRILRDASGPYKIFVAGELGEARVEKAVRPLAHTVLRSGDPSVRAAAVDALKRIEHPDTALLFAGALDDPSWRVRVRAAQAVTEFPDRRAVGHLIATLRYAWTGFGRAHFFSLVRQTYISDYELVSGGTGLTVVEVADPIISTVETGVVLDVHVRCVEAVTKIYALEKITGKDFGPDINAWLAWWKTEEIRARTEQDQPIEIPAVDPGNKVITDPAKKPA